VRIHACAVINLVLLAGGRHEKPFKRKGGMQDRLLVEELLEHLHDFNEVVTYKRVGV